jgi:hypothetical protein
MVSTEVTDTFQKIKEQQEKGRYCGVSLKYFFPDFRELPFGDDYRELTLLNRQELIDY